MQKKLQVDKEDGEEERAVWAQSHVPFHFPSRFVSAPKNAFVNMTQSLIWLSDFFKKIFT